MRRLLFFALIMASTLAPAQQVLSQSPSNPFYYGDGGKGTRLAVLAPAGIRLTEDDNYLPTSVQGALTARFNRFSAITVIDRQNQDKILENQNLSANGDYSDKDFISIGNLTNAQLILAGSITKTNIGYSLELGISDAANGERKYSYIPKTYTFTQIESGEAAAAAVEDLLTQMGITLTARGKTELRVTQSIEAVKAETALSRGIVALKSGTVVEALSYFIQASNANPQLAEAISRINIVRADITSGNVGADRRNDIAWRRAWVARLAECDAFVANYRKNTPMAMALVYSTDLQYGKTDYSRETLPIWFDISLLIADKYWPDPVRGVIDAVYTGFVGTGRTSEWRLNWPNNSASSGAAPVGWSEIKRYDTAVELLNDQGEIIGKQTLRLSAGWNTSFSGGKTTASYSDTRTTVTFPAVDANKVTDRLSIRVASLNGMAAESVAQANRVSIMTWADWEVQQRRMIQGNRR